MQVVHLAAGPNRCGSPPATPIGRDRTRASPNAIIVNVQRGLSDPPSEPTFYRAFGPLEDNGFIETIPEREKFYRTTEKGRRYLAGEDPEAKD